MESIAYGREALRLVEKGGAGVEYGPAAVSLAVTLLGWEPTEALVVAHAAVERLRQLGDRASLSDLLVPLNAARDHVAALLMHVRENVEEQAESEGRETREIWEEAIERTEEPANR